MTSNIGTRPAGRQAGLATTAPHPPIEPTALAATALALARRLVDGATLWCASPKWPWHAQHLAVEFVHPVVVGARAFDAVAVPDGDPVDWLRPQVRPGDVVAVIAEGADPTAGRLARRVPLWGARTLWLAVGSPPTEGAHHALVVAADPEAAWSGQVVLAYHLLWELTQLCLEHPGLLAEPPPATAADTGHCITCSDEGRLAEVCWPGTPDATVRTERGEEVVDVTAVGPLEIGTLLLVHAGTAVAVVAEDEPPPRRPVGNR